MIEHLANMLLDFGGVSTHTRCFLYTTNLVAKALIKEFDAKPKRHGDIGEEVGTMNDTEVFSTDEAQLVRELEELQWLKKVSQCLHVFH